VLHDTSELRRRYQRGLITGWFLVIAWSILAWLVWFAWHPNTPYGLAADILIGLLVVLPIRELVATYRNYRRAQPAELPSVVFAEDLGYLGNETALHLILRELPASATARFLLHEPTRTVKVKKPTTELYHRCTEPEWQDLLFRLNRTPARAL